MDCPHCHCEIPPEANGHCFICDDGTLSSDDVLANLVLLAIVETEFDNQERTSKSQKEKN